MNLSPFKVCALFAPAALIMACGSSGTTTGAGGSSSASTSTATGAGGSKTTSTTTATSTSTGTTSTSTGTSTSTSATTGTGTGAGGGMPTCKENCITNDPMGAKVFEGYELKECGCAAGTPCNAMCTAECADPNKLMMNTPCGMCLLAEAGKGMQSACTTKAGLSDCAPDPKCSPFLQCELGCP